METSLNHWFSEQSYLCMFGSQFIQLSGKLWIVQIGCLLPKLPREILKNDGVL